MEILVDRERQLEILLVVGSFDVDGGVEMTLIQVYIDVQKHDLGGGGIPSELDGMAAIEGFKKLDERVGTVRPEEEDV